MIRKLLADTTITALSFFFVSLIGLLLVPILIGAYGLVGLGLIMLVRMFLPSGVIGIVDFGVCEIATQLVALARESNKWNVAYSGLRFLARMIAIIAVIVGMCIFTITLQICDWFNVSPEFQNSFAVLLRSTSVVLPILFLGLMAEGVIRGFQKFSILRLVEIIVSLCYAIAVVYSVSFNYDYSYAAWSFLLLQSIKSVIFIIIALKSLPQDLDLNHEDLSDYVLERARLYFTARILGTIQHQVPTLLIGLLVGPVAVGIYDIIVRLPKFAKSALAVMGNTLMPTAIRLDASGNKKGLQLISELTISLLPAIIFPPIAVISMFSRDVLNIWLGAEFVSYAPWVAVFLIIPALNTIVSVQNNTFLNDSKYLSSNNRIAILQTVIQLSISLIMVRLMAQNAFILGQVLAAVLIFVAQIQLGQTYTRISQQLYIRFYIFTILLIMTATIFIALTEITIFNSVITMIAGMFFMCVMMWLITVFFFLNKEGRENLLRLIKVTFKIS